MKLPKMETAKMKTFYIFEFLNNRREVKQ